MVPDHLLYLAIDAGVLILPLLFSFHPRIRFYQHWRAFLIGCGLVMIPFIVWDIVFTQMGIWGFNPRYLSGVGLAGLPLEEWLFFICIPFACVFTFYSIGLLRIGRLAGKWYSVFAAVGMVFMIIAIFNVTRAYTFFAFLLCGAMLFYLSMIAKPDWLPRAMITYLVVLPFFFISNGLLTGAWIPEEIVWYNDSENLGMRLLTIPVEDAVYGFLLVLLNMTLFQKVRQSDKD